MVNYAAFITKIGSKSGNRIYEMKSNCINLMYGAILTHEEMATLININERAGLRGWTFSKNSVWKYSFKTKIDKPCNWHIHVFIPPNYHEDIKEEDVANLVDDYITKKNTRKLIISDGCILDLST